MNFDDYRYNELAFKASHNSYQRDEDIHEQLQWNEHQQYDGGCRGLEIDITRHSDSSNGTSLHYFQVSHEKGGSGQPLADYLGYLLSWHLANTDHDPVFVDLDIKSEEGSVEKFPGEIDTYLTEWFSRPLLYTPGDILTDPALDLVGTVQKDGWPTFGDLRGKFLFCLSGTDAWKQFYAEKDPTIRLCFADVDVKDTAETNPIHKGNRAIANVHLYSDDYSHWKKLVPSLREAALLVRGYVLNSDSLWDKAQGAGVNILATDKVSDYDWARVGNAPFAVSPA
jgi:hypothetical protein